MNIDVLVWIWRLEVCTEKVQIVRVKRSIDLDDDLGAEVEKVASLMKEKPATVLRLAIRAGLPTVVSRFQSSRPPGYFAGDYPLPADRLKLEKAMSRVATGPDR